MKGCHVPSDGVVVNLSPEVRSGRGQGGVKARVRVVDTRVPNARPGG